MTILLYLHTSNQWLLLQISTDVSTAFRTIASFERIELRKSHLLHVAIGISFIFALMFTFDVVIQGGFTYVLSLLKCVARFACVRLFLVAFLEPWQSLNITDESVAVADTSPSDVFLSITGNRQINLVIIVRRVN